MLGKSPVDFLLYGGIEKEDFDYLRPRLWKRNVNALRITAFLSGAIGAVFLAVNLIARSDVWFPYTFLLCGSVLASFVLFLIKGRENVPEIYSILLCYGEMIMVCVYAGILSVQRSNYDFPATSVIVFIALIPLSIDDRPVRMYAVMLGESAAYLAVSYLFKSPAAFRLDLLNVITFCLVGMILYAVICTRNVLEIHQSGRIEKIQRDIISSLGAFLEERDESTGGHIERAENYVELLVDKMKKSGRYPQLTDDYCKNIILAAPMHDIGKIKIPDKVLQKAGRLNDSEYNIMKEHSRLGAEIIRKTMGGMQDRDYCDVACNIARSHHERYDGKGYPDALKGDKIPLEARIMALADVYDALVSERVYKKAYPVEKAKMIIKEGSGTQFDPDLARLFLECV